MTGRLLLALAIVLLPPAVSAETVAITASAESQGQAYVFRLPSGCHAATAAHVLERAGPGTVPILRAADGREAQGLDPVRPDSELDLAFLRVVGALASPCGSAENLGDDHLDPRLRTAVDLVLRVARPGSSVQQIPLRLSRANETYLFLAPTSARPIDRLMQSMSGGLVASHAGLPHGMFLAIDHERGLAQALRFDVIKALALRALARPAQDADGGPARPSLSVVRWKGRTLDPARPPAAVLSGGEWHVQPIDRRAELELAAPAPVRISGVHVGAAATRGADADILTVWIARERGQDWVLLRTCPRLPPGAGRLFDCPVAPVEVGAVRLEFGLRGGGKLAVGPVEVR